MRTRRTSAHVLFTVIMMIVFMYSSQSLAQANQYKRKAPAAAPKADAAKSAPGAPAAPTPATTPATGSGDKLDVTDLEQKYWAPKDTDFSVVQNRAYTKVNKKIFSLLAGPIINEDYSEGTNFMFATNYFWSERMGVEVNYLKGNLRNNQITQDFWENPSNTLHIVPNHSKMQSIMGASFNYVPIYAKVSFLNSSIIYFDLAVSPGLAMVTYEQQIQDGNRTKSAIAFTLDITQYYFLSNNWALRVDIKNAWYSEDKVQYLTGAHERNIDKNLTHFLIGAMFYF